jgi:hypothetical protein
MDRGPWGVMGSKAMTGHISSTFHLHHGPGELVDPPWYHIRRNLPRRRGPLNGSPVCRLCSQVAKSRNEDVREHFNYGFGIHHAGMLRPDRSLTERCGPAPGTGPIRQVNGDIEKEQDSLVLDRPSK